MFAQQSPQKRVARIYAANNTFVIPPGEGEYRVNASTILAEDTELVSLKPHMHLRGKSMEFRAVYPTGEKEILLNVPQYSFNWQLEFVLDRPKVLPKGTKLECTERFDNSKSNPENPDPTKTVIWGQQSFDEMVVCMFNVAFDAKITTEQMLAPARP